MNALDAEMKIEIPVDFNITSYFLDRNIVEGKGNKTAIVQAGRKYTYGEVSSLTNCVGNKFLELGLEQENRVLLALNDSIELVASWFATIKVGGVACTIYTHLQEKDYEYYLNYTRAKIVVFDKSTLAKVRSAAKNSPYLKHILVVGDDDILDDGVEVPFSEVLKCSSSLEPAQTHKDDIALWKFTTGTTGKPKAAVHCQHDTLYSFLTYGLKVLGYRQDDIILSVPKLFFGYARDAALVYPFGVGATTIIFPERSTPELMFDLIKQHQPTVLIQVPTMMNAMLKSPSAKTTSLKSLRFCTSSGEKLPDEIYKEWKRTFGVEVLEGVGSAEAYHVYLSNTLENVVPGSAGKVVPGYEAKIVGPDLEELPAGEIGRLMVKGDSAALFYWQDHEKSKATFQGDWINTGDLFKKDADGTFWYSGRADQLLKISGVMVSPYEVENCLLTHPDVKDCTVIGADNGEGLMTLSAFLVIRDKNLANDSLAGQLKSFVKSKLAAYKYPRVIVFLDELPKNAQGKVDRNALKNFLLDGERSV